MSENISADDMAHLKEVNFNLNQALQDIHALSDDMRRVMVVHSFPEILEIYFEVISKILDISVEKCKYFKALSSDGPYELRMTHEGAVKSDEELFVDFEMIDYLNAELKPVQFDRANEVREIWIPMVRTARILGITQVFINNSEKWNQSVEDRIRFFTMTTASALQSTQFSNELIEHTKEVELQQSRFKQLFEAVNVGLVSIDNERKLLHVNRNASMMCRIAQYEIGQDYTEVLAPEVCTLLGEMLASLESEGFVLDQSTNVQIDEGNSISIGINIVPLTGTNNEREGYVLTLRDMTASKELERLRKLDEMKSDFVNNVSHELRTPLTSIAAYTEALQGMLEEDKYQQFLGVISSEADRLLSLIENLLNVSRIESGKMILHKEEVNLGELAAKVVDITKVQSEKHEVKMVVHGEIPTLMLDKDKMIEVLLNIVGNAIKYSPDGGNVTIAISMSDGNVTAAISDQGIGLTPEDCQKVFDQFYRVDSSATATIGGTGLGLAITQSIVTAHGGVIKVSSVLGEGSTFSIVLPCDSSGGSDEIELFDNNSMFF